MGRRRTGKAGPKRDKVVGRPYGKLQTTRRTVRKLFDRGRKKRFLEHLAATSNVKASAHAAGVTPECTYQHRVKDAAFRDGWAQALEIAQGRLRTQMLEEAMGSEAIVIDGEVVVPAKPFDPELAKFLMREHGRGLAGIPRGGVKAKAADWEEIDRELIRRFRALGVRLIDAGILPGPPRQGEGRA